MDATGSATSPSGRVNANLIPAGKRDLGVESNARQR